MPLSYCRWSGAIANSNASEASRDPAGSRRDSASQGCGGSRSLPESDSEQAASIPQFAATPAVAAESPSFAELRYLLAPARRLTATPFDRRTPMESYPPTGPHLEPGLAEANERIREESAILYDLEHAIPVDHDAVTKQRATFKGAIESRRRILRQLAVDEPPRKDSAATKSKLRRGVRYINGKIASKTDRTKRHGRRSTQREAGSLHALVAELRQMAGSGWAA